MVLVTARLPDAALHRDLAARLEDGQGGAIRTVARIGDCIIPGTIASAVFDGRRFAEELDVPAEGLLRIVTEPVALDERARFDARHVHRTVSAASPAEPGFQVEVATAASRPASS